MAATSTPRHYSSMSHTHRCCSLILRSPSHTAVRAAGQSSWQEPTFATSCGTSCWPLLLTVASSAIHKSSAHQGVSAHQPCLPRTTALRRHKRLLATSSSRICGLVLPSVRSTSSARRFTVPRIESFVAVKMPRASHLD